jgi:hypothetical protein
MQPAHLEDKRLRRIGGYYGRSGEDQDNEKDPSRLMQ